MQILQWIHYVLETLKYLLLSATSFNPAAVFQCGYKHSTKTTHVHT